MPDIQLDDFVNLPDFTFNPFEGEEDEYAISDFADEPYGVIHLDGVPIPVKGDVDTTQLAVLQPKFTVGEPNKDSDNLMSVWIQSDWTGGGQISDINEASDTQRFRYGTTETRYPNMMTLPPETLDYGITGGDGNAYPLGDYMPSTSLVELFWVAFGTKARYWDKGSLAYVGGMDLTAAPVNKSVVFDDLLFIPQGASGYDIFDGVNPVVHDNAVLPVSIVEWDDKLLFLETTGQIRIYDGTSFAIINPALKLRGNRTPRHLINWWDPNREAKVYVVTNRDLWVIDPLIPRLYRTGLHFPVHPDQGLGAVAWRDDAMYVSVATGLHQFSLGGVISAVGLDRNDGLPTYLRGAIVDLEGEYNSMLALVQGAVETTSSDSEGEILELPGYEDDALVVSSSDSSARSTLQRWTGQGWHTAWESDASNGVPTRVMVSQADGEYRIWWGYGDRIFTQLLRRAFNNPRQGAEIGIDRFAPTASIKTGRFDANMAMFHKLASHLEFHMDPLSTQTVDVSYQTDYTYPDWNYAGQLTGTGKKVLKLDPNGDGFDEGVKFHWIEFQYVFNSNSPLQTPIMMWASMKFIKLPLQTLSWQFVVPLVHQDQWRGLSPMQISDFLDDLASSERFFTFKHQDDTFRVRLAQVRGPKPTGKDYRGVRYVNLVELDPDNEAT